MGKALLVNITSHTPDAVQIWGFHNSCTVSDVAEALKTIALTLSGKGHVINIMSGTHGYCSGQIGAVATREQRFTEEDRGLTNPLTRDGQPIRVAVHDFNTASLAGVDHVTSAMAKLNGDMRKIVGKEPGTHAFLLAYCCSAGEKK